MYMMKILKFSFPSMSKTYIFSKMVYYGNCPDAIDSLMRLDCGGTTFCMNYEFPMWPNQ
jgi:hypothetical protein